MTASRHTLLRASLALLAGLSMLAALVPGPVAAVVATGKTFTVNSTADQVDASIGNGVCRTSVGTCTLRAAIQEANKTAAKDTIKVPAGVFKLTRSGHDATAARGDLDITNALSIVGAGATKTIVDANGAVTHDRAFDTVTAAGAVSISGLAIRNGKASDVPESGGAIRVTGAGGVPVLTLAGVLITASSGAGGGGVDVTGGTLKMTNTSIKTSAATNEAGGAIRAKGATVDITGGVISGNSAKSGAGISQEGGTVSLVRVTVASNAAAAVGGGYHGVRSTDYPTTQLTVTSSTFKSNSATVDGGGAYTEGSASITGSTFDANSAGGSGGGLALRPGTSTSFAMYTSTVSGNYAPYGGGIDTSGAPTTPQLQFVVNSTIANNNARTDGGGVRATAAAQLYFFSSTIARNGVVNLKLLPARHGGGIYADTDSYLHMRNTILAKNFSWNGIDVSQAASDCYTVFHSVESQGWNLVGDTTNCSISGTTFGNITGVDPLLAPLAKDGAATSTMELLAGSPAINKGETGCQDPVGAALSTDQVGTPRPGASACDIGASEVATLMVATSTDVFDGNVLETGEKTSTGGGVNATATTFRLGDTALRQQYRAILDFYTTLPPGAVVVRARLKIKESSLTGAANPFTAFGTLVVDSQAGSFGTRTLAGGDFSATGRLGVSSVPSAAVSSWHTASIPLNTVNTSGTTQYRLRFSLDDNNDGIANYLSFVSGNGAADSVPVLEVEYYVP